MADVTPTMLDRVRDILGSYLEGGTAVVVMKTGETAIVELDAGRAWILTLTEAGLMVLNGD